MSCMMLITDENQRTHTNEDAADALNSVLYMSRVWPPLAYRVDNKAWSEGNFRVGKTSSL